MAGLCHLVSARRSTLGLLSSSSLPLKRWAPSAECVVMTGRRRRQRRRWGEARAISQEVAEARRWVACAPCQREATEGCFSQHKANDVRGPAAVSPDGRRLESEGEREIWPSFRFFLFQCFNFNDRAVIHHGTQCSRPLNILNFNCITFLLINARYDGTLHSVVCDHMHSRRTVFDSLGNDLQMLNDNLNFNTKHYFVIMFLLFYKSCIDWSYIGP